MIVYPNIEEYIEVISGYKDVMGKAINYFIAPQRTLIKMSDFDQKFAESIGDQLMRGIALTDRQAVTVDRLLSTYSSQLAAHSIGMPDHKNYRDGLRVLNRHESLILANNKLYFRFRYDASMVETIKSFARTSQGHVSWDSDEKAWVFANTEYNLSWVVALAQAHNIEVTADCQTLFDQIVELEQIPYRIELVYQDNKLSITNAPDSMIEYIENSVGFDDIYALVDMSGALGYTVSDEIREAMSSELGEPFVKLCSDRTIGMSNTADLGEIVEWAIAVDRLPICIYSPNFTKPRLGCLPTYFTEEEIMTVSISDPVPDPFVVPNGIKVIYTTKVIPTWASRLPLLISHVNLMHGTSKRTFTQVAEKIVYNCPQLPR